MHNSPHRSDPEPNLPASTFEPRVLLRVSRWSTVLCLLLLPAIVLAVSQIKSSTAAVAQWLPAASEQTLRYAKFLEWFEDDLFLELSWPGCHIDDPQLTALATALRSQATVNPQLAIRRVTTSTELVDKLMHGPAQLSRADALHRLQGVFVGPAEAAVLLIELSDSQSDPAVQLIETVIETASRITTLPREQLKLGGGVYEAATIDQASDRSFKRFVIPASLAALLVAWIGIRSIRLTLVVLLISAYCQLSSIALITLFGGQLNAVLIVLPTLIFMLSVSAGVHLVNYYRDAGGDNQPLAAVLAVRAGLLPCTLASCTTAVGLLSLLVSQLKPVRDFGFYAAISVLASTAILLLVFPTLVGFRWRRSSAVPTAYQPHSERNQLDAKFTHFIAKHANLLATSCTLLVIVVAVGIGELKSTVKIENMFERDSEIINNYTWLEQNIGPLISVETVLSFAPDSTLDDLQRAELLAQIHYAVAAVPEVGGTYSALTFMPPLPHSGGMRNTARRAVFRKKLASEKIRLADEGLLASDAAGEHWRVTARVPVLHSLNYGELTERIVAACQPIAARTDSLPGVRLTFTGLNPVFHEAQQLLFTDLRASFAMAFLLITPMMMLVLQSMWGGLLAMLPNVAPVAIVFGSMGWLGIPLDIASILTASVALGIAVDDTLHFCTWFRRARSRTHSDSRQVADNKLEQLSRQPADGATVSAATQFAFEKCAVAMLQTTCICCAAMLVFIPTEFIPARKFAILMSIMLATALIGDLLLLPALLCSRLGRWVMRSP